MSEKQSMSPTPVKTIEPKYTIDFLEAMRQIAEGKKAHKLEWKDKEFYGFLNGEILSLHKPDGQNYQWIISLGDMKGTDYIII